MFIGYLSNSSTCVHNKLKEKDIIGPESKKTVRGETITQLCDKAKKRR